AWNLNRRTSNGVATDFVVDNKNELSTQAGITCTYDANGNLVLVGDPAISGTINYLYDDENRLSEIYTNYNIPSRPGGPLIAGTTSWRTDFVYDGLGRLRKRLEYLNEILNSTTVYIYDGFRVIQERDANNTPTVSYTRGSDLSGSLEGAGGIGGLLARSSGATHNFYFADGNGNITALLDGNQAVAASYRYDPFGNTISSFGGLATL